jgi:dihydroorotase
MVLTLVRDGIIGMPRAFELLATNPARLLGVDAGSLEEGQEADVILVDPEKPWVIDRRKMAATADNTPFDGQPTQGRVTALFKGGVQIGD